MTGKGILIVLDAVGIGGATDANDFADMGADTLGNIKKECIKGRANFSRFGQLNIPNLASLGIYASHAVAQDYYSENQNFFCSKNASFACASEISKGKDTPTGHWELAGLPLKWNWKYFENKFKSFSEDQIKPIINKFSLTGILGNCHSSGTEIIKKYGEEHILSLKPIFYTSKDSVVQIACHENIFGLKKLYELCEFSAKVFHPLKVGRVIARPFLVDNSGTFFRTKNRKDYTFPPPNKTLCDLVVENNRSCHAIGKIADIFSNRGISTSVSGLSDDALFYKMIDVIKKAKNGDLIFANFVEFDSLYGHRRDVAGFAGALERFDLKLVKLLEIINPNDFLIITADHGNDPTFKGTDHTREKVPVLMVGNYAQKGNNGNIVFSDVGATMAAFLNLSGKLKGTNIFNDNNKLEKKCKT